MQRLEKITKVKLLDGLEEEVLTQYFSIVLEKEYNITPSDFYDSPLKLDSLNDIVSIDEFDKIVLERNYESVQITSSYKCIDGLFVYFLIKDNLLFLFSLGEIQSSRFRVDIDSVWELTV